MDDTIGNIVDGEVINLTNFGAFVKLTESGKEGLVHISEIAHQYVNDINQFIAVGDKVKVKLLEQSNNKLKLSIKQAQDNTEKKEDTTLFIQKKSKNVDFEDKLTFFMKKSEEKLIDIRRNLKTKQGIVRRKKKK